MQVEFGADQTKMWSDDLNVRRLPQAVGDRIRSLFDITPIDFFHCGQGHGCFVTSGPESRDRRTEQGQGSGQISLREIHIEIALECLFDGFAGRDRCVDH